MKSFQDLEVYQKLLAVSVAVSKRITLSHSRPDRESICIDSHFRGNDKLVTIALNLPLLIAEAHSLRFSEPETAIRKLERVMLGCNQAVVYLEQYRDIENPSTGSGQAKIETEFFEEQIKNLLATRMKILHLQMSWKKFAIPIKDKKFKSIQDSSPAIPSASC